MQAHDAIPALRRPASPSSPAPFRALAALVAVVGLLLGPVSAWAFDPDALSAADRSVISTLLEYDRTNASRELPSGGTVTVRQTQTRPQICRFFTIERAGAGAEEGVGCRVGTQQWALTAELPTAEPETVPALVEAPDERPGPPRRDEGPSRQISAPETVTVEAPTLSPDTVPVPPSRQVALAGPGDAPESAPFVPPPPPARPTGPASAPVTIATAETPAPESAPEVAEDASEDLAAASDDAAVPVAGLPMLAGTPVPVPPDRQSVQTPGDAPVVADAPTAPLAEPQSAEVTAPPADEAAEASEAIVPARDIADLTEDDAVTDVLPDGTAAATVAVPPRPSETQVVEVPAAEPATGLTEADQALAPFQAPAAPPPPGAIVPDGAEEIIIVTDGSTGAGDSDRSDGFEALLSRLTGEPTPDPVEETAPPIVAAESVLREAFIAPPPPRRPAAPATLASPAANPAIATTEFPLPPVRPGRG